ncbi:MAG: family 43 glycosylhydrolase [Bacteroidaceae bacterium]|nr:family 43 glycosylhydrolase [Bacteroidaceae bacterium]
MIRVLATALLVLTASLTTLADTYTNPVITLDVADPTVQRGTDGAWYCVATGGGMYRSSDLTHWISCGSAFMDYPCWNEGYVVWATDISRVGKGYIMHYALAKWGDETITGIGAATAQTVEGPYRDMGKMFATAESGVKNCIDPCYIEEGDRKYLVWGSFNGIYIAELEDDGFTVRWNTKKQIAGTGFEGAMLHRHGGYYYLLASVGSCCEGANSTYKTVVGRSTSLMGEYEARSNNGTLWSKKMLKNAYDVLISRNNRFVGPGHNSEIITDDEGQDWILYHAYDMTQNESERMLMLDRIVWEDGWPMIEGGTPSTSPQQAPVFHSGDGAKVSYRFLNLDLSKSACRFWDLKAEGTSVQSGQGSVHMPTTTISGAGTFSMTQTVEKMRDGLYELRYNGTQSGSHICAKVGDVFTPIGQDSSLSDASDASSRFLQGQHEQHAYGLVVGGKLTIGFCSDGKLNSDEKAYLGNIEVIYREKSSTALHAVMPKYKEMARQIASKSSSLEHQLLILQALHDMETANTDDERYNCLVALHTLMQQLQTPEEPEDIMSGTGTPSDPYIIETATHALAFAKAVNGGATDACAVLANDINLKSRTWTPIGTTTKPYEGTFDGAGHRILNMKLSNSKTYQGFFGAVTDGACIHHLIIDSSCSIRAASRAAGLAGGSIGGSDNVKKVYITCCGNEASVYTTNENAAGIFGTNTNGAASIIIRDCYNSGTIEGGSDVGAISGWLGGGWSNVRNTYNTGQVKTHAGAVSDFARHNGCSFSNCYWLSTTGTSNCGGTSVIASQVKSGELAYMLAGNSSGSVTWTQAIGKDTHPIPWDEGDRVYRHSQQKCNGEATNLYIYNNVEGNAPVTQSHTFGTNGMCSICQQAYSIQTAAQLMAFAEAANAGAVTASAVLTADISLAGKAWIPIGTAEHPYEGEFDGGGHRIMDMSLQGTEDYQGFFGIVTDGVHIHDLIIDNSCSVRGGNYCSGLVAGSNGGKENRQELLIERCGNEASVNATGINAAGIFGCNMQGMATVIIRNCYNTGTIHGDRECGAISGWLGGGWSHVSNCYNAGTVTIGDAVCHDFGRNNGCWFHNCYYLDTTDTYDVTNGCSKEVSSVTGRQVRNGKLCTLLGAAFGQQLNTDAMPTPGAARVKPGITLPYYNLTANGRASTYDLMLCHGIEPKLPTGTTSILAATANYDLQVQAGRPVFFVLPVAANADCFSGTVYRLHDFSNDVLNFVTVSQTTANTPYMLLPDHDGYLFRPDAPILAAALPRTGNVTVKDGTQQAYHIGIYEPTTDVTTLLSISEKDSYIFLSYDGENTEQKTTCPALIPYEACLIVTGDNVLAHHFDIALDGNCTGLQMNGEWTMDNETAVYDLSGRKIKYHSATLPSQLKKGLYIINGKKMMVK